PGLTSDADYQQILAAGGRKADVYRGLRAIRDNYLGLIRTGYPDIPRRVSGYNLDHLLPEMDFHVARALVGSESTLVTVLHAEVELVPVPGARSLVVLGYPDITDAADAVPLITSHRPLAVEGLDERLGDYLRDFRILLDRHGYQGVSMYGHFGHGCVHTRIPFELRTSDGVAAYRAFVEAAADLVVAYGGSLSGEHGDGQSRGELLPKMFGNEIVQAFREFKSIWDPDWKMNPGKVVDPYRLDENLRLGADYHPWEPKTHFKFPEDKGSLPQATLRCVGVGKCRQYDGGVMCPSFRVTREEEHSTRGRAHLLWEMTKGEIIRNGWHHYDVKHSLDLCLS